jgi:hypothetical protein
MLSTTIRMLSLGNSLRWVSADLRTDHNERLLFSSPWSNSDGSKGQDGQYVRHLNLHPKIRKAGTKRPALTFWLGSRGAAMRASEEPGVSIA